MRIHHMLLAVVVLSCGGPEHPAVEAPGAPVVIVDPAVPWSEADVLTVASAAVVLWGGSIGRLDGARIEIVPAMFMCGAVHTCGCEMAGGSSLRVAAENWDGPVRCPGMSALAHEIGHLVIGAPDHLDARWCSKAFWAGFASALADRLDPTCAEEVRKHLVTLETNWCP